MAVGPQDDAVAVILEHLDGLNSEGLGLAYFRIGVSTMVPSKSTAIGRLLRMTGYLVLMMSRSLRCEKELIPRVSNFSSRPGS